MPNKRLPDFALPSYSGSSRADAPLDILERLIPTLDLFLEQAVLTQGGSAAFVVVNDPLTSGHDFAYSPNGEINKRLNANDSAKDEFMVLVQQAFEARKPVSNKVSLDGAEQQVHVVPLFEKKQPVAAFGFVGSGPVRQQAVFAAKVWNAIRLQIETARKACEAAVDGSIFQTIPVAAVELDITKFVEGIASLKNQGYEHLETVLMDRPDLLKDLFEPIPVLRVNHQMLAIMGVESSESFLGLFPQAAVDIRQPLVALAISAAVHGRKSAEGLYRMTRLEGCDLVLSVRIVFNVRSQGTSTCIAYVTDLTDRMRDELRLRLSTEIDRALLGTATLAKLSRTVLVGIRDLIPYSIATIRTFDDAAKSYNLVAYEGEPGLASLVRRSVGEADLPEPPKSMLVCINGESEMAQHMALQPFFEAGIQTVALVILVVRKEIVGYIFLGSRQANIYSREHLEILRNVADDLAVGLHTLKLQNCAKTKTRELEKRVKERTAQLEAANKELESFFYSISHELRSPLRAIEGYAAMTEDEGEHLLSPEGMQNLHRIRTASQKMSRLIEDLLKLARYTRSTLSHTKVDLSEIATRMCEALAHASPNRITEFKILPNVVVKGDHQFLKSLIDELIGNAWIYSSKGEKTFIEFGAYYDGEETIYYVRDNGCGFDMEHAKQLFLPFHRLHRQDEFPGTGMGLATADRIVSRHGGRIWARSTVGQGATFYFTLGE